MTGTAQNIAQPLAPVSWGELIDKITILEIKSRHIKSPGALTNVICELKLLQRTAEPALIANPALLVLKSDLTLINESLWDIEDRIRQKEAEGRFDAEFIELARSVYITNDSRAAKKHDINLMLKSALIEVKSYNPY